jgi:hypothetical protein
MDKIEALVDALWTYAGTKDPESKAYSARNPLALMEYDDMGKATGRMRTFSSLHGGLAAAKFDIMVKVSGKSRARLNGDNFTLRGLCISYSMPELTSDYVAKFLRKALKDPSINSDTRLDYFATNSNMGI